MPLPVEVRQRFDAAAAEAKIEFDANVERWSALDLCAWMERWYGDAAYDRLCRIMRRRAVDGTVELTEDQARELGL